MKTLDDTQQKVLKEITEVFRRNYPKADLKAAMEIQQTSMHVLAQQIAPFLSYQKDDERRKAYLKSRLDLVVVLSREYESAITRMKDKNGKATVVQGS